MRAFRESGIGQLFFGLIVAAIILAFVLTGKGGPSMDGFKEDCAVEVGKHCIEPKEFFAAYGLVASIGLNEKAAKQMGLKELVARGLAERELLVEEAEKLGIATSQDAMDAELLDGRTRVSLPAQGAERLAASLALCVDGPNGCEPGTIGLRALPVKKDGVFDIDLYKRMVLAATGRSTSLFKEMQAREFTAQRMRELLTSSVRVSEEEAFLSYARVRSTATARVVKLQASWFERFVSPPSKADVDKWRSEHADELKLAVDQAKNNWKVGCPVVEEILLESQGDETSAALLARAQLVKGRISSGFDTLARRESSSESAALGGRVGCLDQNFGVGADELIAAAGELKQPGDVSAPIVTARGVELVRLVDRVTSENVAALAESFFSYKLASTLTGQEAARKYGESLIAKLEAGGDIAALTDELTLAAVSAGPLGATDNPGVKHADKPLSDISRAFSIEQSPLPDATGESASALVFALDKPNAVVAHPVPLRGGGFAVLQLKEKDIATREKFAADRDRVLGQLRSRKAEEALSKHVAALVEKAGGIQLNEKHVPSEKPKDGAPKDGAPKDGAPG